jgi:hypothetical protein
MWKFMTASTGIMIQITPASGGKAAGTFPLLITVPGIEQGAIFEIEGNRKQLLRTELYMSMCN